MTVESLTNKKVYIANGATSAFTYDFIVLEEAHLEVYLAGVLQSSGFTTSGIGDPAGGEVTFDVAPADQTTVTIRRLVPIDQTSNYVPYDKFPADRAETDFDIGCMIDQQLQEEIDRATKAPIDDDGTTDYTLPPYNGGKGIMWDEAEKKLINSDDNLNSIVSDANAAKDAAQASASQAASSANNSANSAANSASSASASAASSNKAQEWAENPEDDPVEPDQFSSFHWAKKAEEAAGSVVITPTGRKNLISNGGFDVWQRGDTFGGGTKYTSDLWIKGSTIPTVTRETTDLPAGFGNALSTTNEQGMRYLVELPRAGNAGVFAVGETFTLSFWAKTSVDFSLSLSFSEGDSGTNLVLIHSEPFTALGSTWQKYETTFTVGVSPNPSNFSIRLLMPMSGLMTGVQLERGDKATDFEQLTYAETLAICQREYNQLTFMLLTEYKTGSNKASCWDHAPSMRVAPTITYDSISGMTSVWIDTYEHNAVLSTDNAVSGSSTAIQGVYAEASIGATFQSPIASAVFLESGTTVKVTLDDSSELFVPFNELGNGHSVELNTWALTNTIAPYVAPPVPTLTLEQKLEAQGFTPAEIAQIINA